MAASPVSRPNTGVLFGILVGVLHDFGHQLVGQAERDGPVADRLGRPRGGAERIERRDGHHADDHRRGDDFDQREAGDVGLQWSAALLWCRHLNHAFANSFLPDFDVIELGWLVSANKREKSIGATSMVRRSGKCMCLGLRR